MILFAIIRCYVTQMIDRTLLWLQQLELMLREIANLRVLAQNALALQYRAASRQGFNQR